MEKELLHTYFNGNTTEEEEKQIMDWAESSTENYQLYLKERQLWNAMLIHYASDLKLDTFSSPEKKSLHIDIWKAVSIVASLALLFTLSWMQLGKQQDSIGKLQSVLVPAGQRVQLVLADGTRVWLNSKTTFTYPTSFGDEIREVVLDGEGFFEVTRNEEKPFIVKTKEYTVEVLGTTFNVSAYNNIAGSFETSLLEGAVNVFSTNDEARSVTLKPQEKVMEVNGVLQKDMIGNADYFRWKDGLICLDDEPFESLMRRFSAYYDIHITIENPRVLDYHCTGKFRQSDGIEYALKVIQKDLKFDYVRDDPSNTIIIK